MSLLQLSTEILIKIFLYLDVPDAYAIQSVNHFLNNIYKVSLELQYALECKVAHVRDNPNCQLPIVDRLRMLRDREAAWISLEPTFKRTVSAPNLYNRLIQRDHCLFSDSSTIKSLPIREFHENTFRSFEMGDLEYVGYCIEEHDLIACLVCPHISHDRVEVQIKLIQHSTGAAHPLAENPTIILCTTLEDSLEGLELALEVFGENLALILHTEGYARLYVYDWMTGGAKTEPFGFLDCTRIIVLDEDLILVPDFATWSLHIYYIPPSSTGGVVKLICQLRLRDLGLNQLNHISCQSAPNPTGNGKFPKHIPSAVPFIDYPTTALIQIIWHLYDQVYPDYYAVSLVFHRHSIINALPPAKCWSTITTPDIIDWETWGPSVTDESFMEYSDIPTPNNVIFGQYTILQISSSDSEDGGGKPSGAALVKDFNKYHVRRAQLDKDFNNSNQSLSKSKRTLPFRECYLPIQHKCEEYSITDGLIIGSRQNNAPGSESSALSLEFMYFGH